MSTTPKEMAGDCKDVSDEAKQPWPLSGLNVQEVQKEVESILTAMPEDEAKDFEKTMAEFLEKSHNYFPEVRTAYEASEAHINELALWADKRKALMAKYDFTKPFLTTRLDCQIAPSLVPSSSERQMIVSIPYIKGLCHITTTRVEVDHGSQSADRLYLYDAVACSLGFSVEDLKEQVIRYVENNIINAEDSVMKVLIKDRIDPRRYLECLKLGIECEDKLEIKILSIVLNRTIVIVDCQGYVNDRCAWMGNSEPIFLCYNGYNYEAYRVESGHRVSDILFSLFTKRFPEQVLAEIHAYRTGMDLLTAETESPPCPPQIHHLLPPLLFSSSATAAVLRAERRDTYVDDTSCFPELLTRQSEASVDSSDVRCIITTEKEKALCCSREHAATLRK